MRRVVLGALTVLALAAAALPAAAANQAADGPETEYVVLFAEDAATEAGHAAVQAAGGAVVRENTAIGLVTVRSANPSFVTDVAAAAAVEGAALNEPVGFAPPAGAQKDDDVEGLDAAGVTGSGGGDPGVPAAEPLAHLQWDMEMIDATADGSHAVQPGSERVLVGIIDTGIDASHPDLAPNFNAELSRNFTIDIPEVDGPCEIPGCLDPADVDDHGHGTHVAGTVGAALNGFGIAGVAPEVSLVNVRAGQDSGYFFLHPTVDALTYAGDSGIDVVNMSFYIDPWLYNCPSNPADSPEAQLQQRTIIAATQRALDYAHERNVTLVSSIGNAATDLGNPTFDDSSPDYPPGTAYPRDVDNSCLTLPTEGDHVISVTAVGPSGRKAYYSNYGVEQADVAAPGGDRWDYPGTDRYDTPENRILSTYSETAALAALEQNPDNPLIVQYCDAAGVCAYYAWLQGTSMASPHAAGVAGLIVSEFGRPRRFGDIRMRPERVERILKATATEHACPEPRLQTYITGVEPAHNPVYDAYCEGTPQFNGFYGEGIVNALDAVTWPRWRRD